MADSFLSKLVELLSAPENPDLRRAAVIVSGRVGTLKDRALVKALLANLQEADLDVRLAAVDALGQLQVDEALPQLETFARQGGPELEAAARAAGQLGPRGIRAMTKIMEEAVPALRSRMAAVLAKSGTGGGLVATAHALLDPDPKVVDAAARSLAAEVPTLSTAQRQTLGKFLTESLGSKKLAVKTEAALLRVLGTLHHPKTDDVFWRRVGSDKAPEVRAAALHALSAETGPVAGPKLAKLVACAAETDFQVVAYALTILQKVPAGAKNAKLWLKLLEAPDVATRRFAVGKLDGLETAEVARGLLGQLAQPDRTLHDQARQALCRFAKGRQALLDKLLEAGTPDEAWELSRALTPAAKEFAGLRGKLLEKAASYHDRDDRRAQPLWHFLRAIDPAWTRDQIEAKAMTLRKKQKYSQAVGYYRLLAQDPACAEDIRFELAATGLKVSGHNTAVEARQADHALGQFGRLLQNPSFELIGRVKKAKWLDLDDLFYLGFHFVEQTHRAREFGKEVLELVAERAPKKDVGKNARKKLRSAGLA